MKVTINFINVLFIFILYLNCFNKNSPQWKENIFGGIIIREIIIITIATVICIAILTTNNDVRLDTNTTLIESQGIFELNLGTLTKGKEVTWDWEVTNVQNNPSIGLNFWIEDSNNNINYRINNCKGHGSFIAPSTDNWILKWENTHFLDESFEAALELQYDVEILNQPPKALIKPDYQRESGSNVISFSGNGVDYDGIIKSFHWDFGDGNASNIKNPTHTFEKSGTYTITLTVTDDEGAIGKDFLILNLSNP